MIKLDIGAGGKSSDSSFISVDKYVLDADIIADMWELPFEDGTVDVIFASHCLEHVSKYKVIPTLKEWERVLKIDGKLQILVPDMTWTLLWFLRHPLLDRSMDMIFGHQKHDGEYHKTGFTPEIMQMYLELVPGLKLLKWEYYGPTSIADIDRDYETGDWVYQRSINFEILRVSENG